MLRDTTMIIELVYQILEHFETTGETESIFKQPYVVPSILVSSSPSYLSDGLSMGSPHLVTWNFSSPSLLTSFSLFHPNFSGVT